MRCCHMGRWVDSLFSGRLDTPERPRAFFTAPVHSELGLEPLDSVRSVHQLPSPIICLHMRVMINTKLSTSTTKCRQPSVCTETTLPPGWKPCKVDLETPARTLERSVAAENSDESFNWHNEDYWFQTITSLTRGSSRWCFLVLGGVHVSAEEKARAEGVLQHQTTGCQDISVYTLDVAAGRAAREHT
ncbi:unnamed protein product [Pleuronectes platessa]|uniref:Uncharacterized protein n=1 Tax=Pleuronectes platessa TaxID=8262 RepID=A0A9N7YJY5_PLEPL|nr:unnamed protein product [Pleuronectes platessa]